MFNYYENLVSRIKKEEHCVDYVQCYNNRPTVCVVHFFDKSYPVYADGKAKASRITAVLRAIEDGKKDKVIRADS